MENNKIKISHGYLFIMESIIDIKSIRKIDGTSETTLIIYNNGDIDVYDINSKKVKNAIIEYIKYGDIYQ